MSKGYPKKFNVEFKVPANANYLRVPIDVIPDNEEWDLCTFGVNTPEGITLVDIAISNSPIGLYVGPNSFGEFKVLDFFGQPLTVGPKQLSINTVSSVAAETTVSMTIYAFIRQTKVK
ncbi:hypothetical protein D3C79_640670 [compost metagenome]